MKTTKMKTQYIDASEEHQQHLLALLNLVREGGIYQFGKRISPIHFEFTEQNHGGPEIISNLRFTLSPNLIVFWAERIPEQILEFIQNEKTSREEIISLQRTNSDFKTVLEKCLNKFQSFETWGENLNESGLNFEDGVKKLFETLQKSIILTTKPSNRLNVQIFIWSFSLQEFITLGKIDIR